MNRVEKEIGKNFAKYFSFTRDIIDIDWIFSLIAKCMFKYIVKNK